MDVFFEIGKMKDDVYLKKIVSLSLFLSCDFWNFLIGLVIIDMFFLVFLFLCLFISFFFIWYIFFVFLLNFILVIMFLVICFFLVFFLDIGVLILVFFFILGIMFKFGFWLFLMYVFVLYLCRDLYDGLNLDLIYLLFILDNEFNLEIDV